MHVLVECRTLPCSYCSCRVASTVTENHIHTPTSDTWSQQTQPDTSSVLFKHLILATCGCQSAVLASCSKDRPEGSGIFHSSPDCDGGGGGGGVGGGGGSECISSHDNISLTGSSQQATALRRAACMQPLPGSTASLNSTILCNMLTDLHFGHVLGTGSFGECRAEFGPDKNCRAQVVACSDIFGMIGLGNGCQWTVE
jgi:hypothetical protein